MDIVIDESSSSFLELTRQNEFIPTNMRIRNGRNYESPASKLVKKRLKEELDISNFEHFLLGWGSGG